MSNQLIEGGVCAPKGFLASGVHCGIRKNRTKQDLGLIFSEVPCVTAAVFTKNKVKGAPIIVSKKHLLDHTAQAVIFNSGNANTCNADGVEKANAMCKAIADKLGIEENSVLIASTGVIGQPLPLEPILEGIGPLANFLSTEGSDSAALAMMTTDLVKKEAAVEFFLGGKLCHMGAIAKGSGMIHPNMATMLCFVTTDAAVTSELLQEVLLDVCEDTFNMVSVDGDTSTNDTLTLMASGLSGAPLIAHKNSDYELFRQALYDLLSLMSKKMAKDGEGATKLIECRVTGAPDKKTARAVAKSVISSSLVKAAMFGADANWGRILCAIGYTEGDFDTDRTDVWLSSSAGCIPMCKNGAGVEFSEEKAKEILLVDEITVDVDLKAGDSSACAWGCDLTYDYVKINGDYRT